LPCFSLDLVLHALVGYSFDRILEKQNWLIVVPTPIEHTKEKGNILVRPFPVGIQSPGGSVASSCENDNKP